MVQLTMEETTEKINVQGAINSIAVGGVLEFPKSLGYKSVIIRSTANKLSTDYDKEFTVNAPKKSNVIRVTRTK